MAAVYYLSLFVIGLVILIYSSDSLIQSSVKLSLLLRLTPLFIGLVIIAFGTSAPEAGVGIVAAIKDQKDIALGNVIGSNIANIGLILGLCVLFRPLIVERSVLKTEVPLMVGASLLVYILSLDLKIDRIDGIILLLAFIIFFLLSYRGAKRYFDSRELSDFKFKRLFRKVNSRTLAFLLSLIFLLGVVMGANLMIKGGVGLARIFHISPWVIAITIFAIGTSLPELAASLTAVVKKVDSISIGNIVGSNIFNILFVLGIVAVIRPLELDSHALRFEFPYLVGISVLVALFMKTRFKVSRVEGLILVLSYIIFVLILITGGRR